MKILLYLSCLFFNLTAAVFVYQCNPVFLNSDRHTGSRATMLVCSGNRQITTQEVVLDGNVGRLSDGSIVSLSGNGPRYPFHVNPSSAGGAEPASFEIDFSSSDEEEEYEIGTEGKTLNISTSTVRKPGKTVSQNLVIGEPVENGSILGRPVTEEGFFGGRKIIDTGEAANEINNHRSMRGRRPVTEKQVRASAEDLLNDPDLVNRVTASMDNGFDFEQGPSSETPPPTFWDNCKYYAFVAGTIVVSIPLALGLLFMCP